MFFFLQIIQSLDMCNVWALLFDVQLPALPFERYLVFYEAKQFTRSILKLARIIYNIVDLVKSFLQLRRLKGGQLCQNCTNHIRYPVAWIKKRLFEDTYSWHTSQLSHMVIGRTTSLMAIAVISDMFQWNT